MASPGAEKTTASAMETESTSEIPTAAGNPFGGLTLLRSPPRRNSEPSLAFGQGTAPRKRKIGESGLQESTVMGYSQEEMEIIWKKVKELNQVVESHPTTSNSIKAAAKRLQGYVLGLYRRGPLTQVEQPRGSSNAQSQPEETEAMKKDRKAKDIRERMQNAIQTGKLEELVKEEWPERVFEKTKRVKRSIATDSKVRAVFVGSDNQKDLATLKQLEAQFPAVGQLKELQPGKVATIVKMDTLTLDGEEESTNDCARLLVVGKVGDPQNLKDLAEVIGKAVSEMTKREHQEAAFHLPEGLEQMTALKVMECCLAQSDLRAEVCGKGKPRAGGKRDKKGANSGPSTLQVTVRGKTYAEMLKSLKENANPEEAGIVVQGAVKTTDGHLRLRIKETRTGGCGDFTRQIADKVQLTAEVSSGRPGVAVIIKDLDETTTMEEIHRALKENLSGKEAEAKVGAIRVGKTGDGSVIVRLPKNSAQALVAKNRIRVGWARCRVSEFVAPQRCFNCLGLDHVARNCKAPKASGKLCYKCGKEDHVAKDCQNAEECFTCKVPGHFTNSVRCPAYIKHMEESKASK
jgi:Zinc knuckle